MSDGSERIHPRRDPARALARWQGTTATVAPRVPEILADWDEPRSFKRRWSGHGFCVALAALILWPGHMSFLAFSGVIVVADALSLLCFGGRVTIDPARREITRHHLIQLRPPRTWHFDDITASLAVRGMVFNDDVSLRIGRRRLRISVPRGMGAPMLAVVRSSAADRSE